MIRVSGKAEWQRDAARSVKTECGRDKNSSHEVAVSEQSLSVLSEKSKSPPLCASERRQLYRHGTHTGMFISSANTSRKDAAKLAKHRGGKLNYREVVKIIEQTLAALEFAHNLGLCIAHIKDRIF